MDGTTHSPGTAGTATLKNLATSIAQTTAAALAVSRWVDDVWDARHPAAPMHRHDGLALLVDPVTYVGLSFATADLVRHATETAEAFDALTAGGAA